MIGYRSPVSEHKLGISAVDISDKPASARLSLALAVELIEHAGELSFPSALAEALAQVVELAHIGILAFSGDTRPMLLGSASLLSPAVAKQTAHLYLDRYYHADPTADVRAQPLDARKFLFAQRQRAADVSDADYRSACYERSGIVDRMSFFQRSDADAWLAVNVYRDVSQGCFDANDCAQLVALAPLLTASANKHRQILFNRQIPLDQAPADAGDFERKLAQVGPHLSKREFEVCLEMLLGHTAKEIARLLRIAPTSVVTHRQNAYKKLKISDHRQLFSLVLA